MREARKIGLKLFLLYGALLGILLALIPFGLLGPEALAREHREDFLWLLWCWICWLLYSGVRIWWSTRHDIKDLRD